MRLGLDAGLIQKVGQSGQNYRDFRDLFLVQFSRRTSRKYGLSCRGCRDFIPAECEHAAINGDGYREKEKF